MSHVPKTIEMSQVQPQQQDPYADEIDLGKLVRVIWGGRGLIIGFALALLMLVGPYFGFKYLAMPGFKEHAVELRFVLAGAEKGQYPNGTRFQLTDVISSQVLGSVYNKLELEQTGLSTSEFSNSISIQPFAVNREFIDTKYKKRLEAKGLSQAEIEDLEKAYKSELASAEHRSAKLIYAAAENSPLPKPLIKKILFSIPDVWSELAVKEQGVLDLPVVSAKAFDIIGLQNEEFVTGVLLMRDDIKRLQESLNLLDKHNRLELIREPVTGMTLKDLRKQLQTLHYYRLQPLTTMIQKQKAYRDKTYATTFLQGQLEKLDDEVDNLRRKSAVYKAAFEEHIQVARNLNSALTMPSATSTGAELGDQFLGQLLKLGDEIGESEYRQKLIQEQIALNLQAEEIETERMLIIRQLKSLSGKGNGDPEATAKVLDTYVNVVDDFIDLTKTYDALLTIAREQALSARGSLFEFMVDDMRITSYDSVQIKRILLVSILALIIGAMLGVFVTLVRSAAANR